MTLDQETYARNGGAAPLRGYLYQVMVSVWVALDVLLRSRTASVIELEPASQEDLEVQVEDSSPGVLSSLQTASYKLVVQVKWKGGDPWTESTLRKMLTKQGTKRVNGVDQLKDPRVRYLLVTNAALSGPATQLRVRHVGHWPSGGLPGVLEGHDDPCVAKRIAVFDNLDEDRVRELMDKMLTTLARVPVSRLDACVRELHDAAMARMAGSLPRAWRREELEEVVGKHGGYLAALPELETYVAPKNWNAILLALRKKGAVVLKGTSGTGKTLTSEALIAEMRKVHSGLDVVRVAKPSDARGYGGPGPVLFHVDDPWGHFRFDPGAESWNEQLLDLLRHAGENRMFVVTTRSDVLVDAKAEKSVQSWAIGIEGDSYGASEYQSLFKHRLKTLPRPLQILASNARVSVLKALGTPFEVQRFFDSLREIPAEEHDELNYAHVVRAIDDAHTESIEKTLQRQVKERSGQIWATLLWGVLKAYGGTTFNALENIHHAIALRDEARYETGLSELVNFLIAGRSLRQTENRLTYYHPRVDAALEGLLVENPIGTQRTLRDLMYALLEIGAGHGEQDWGQEGVARIIGALRFVPKLKVWIPEDIQAKTDAWLSAQLLSNNGDFEKALVMAARAGSAKSDPAEVARYLTDHAVRNVFDDEERPFVPAADWVVRVRRDPFCGKIVRRFVTELLGQSRSTYHNDFSEQLTMLAGDLTREFLVASEMIVDGGSISAASDVAYKPALADIDAARELTLRVLDQMSKETGVEVRDEQWLAIENGHYSDSYLESMYSYEYEWQIQAEGWLKSFVDAIRGQRGWEILNEDSLSEPLLAHWLHSAASTSRKPGLAKTPELLCLMERTIGTKLEELFWQTADCAWSDDLRERLEAGIQRNDVFPEVQRAMVACVVGASPSSLDVITSNLLVRDDLSGVFEIFAEVADIVPHPLEADMFNDLQPDATNYRTSLIERRVWAESVANKVPGAIGRLVSALFNVNTESPQLFDEATNALLKSLHGLGEVATLAKLELCALAGCLDAIELAEFLQSAPTKEAAERGVELAAAAGFKDLVSGALNHRFSKAKAAAIRTIVGDVAGQIPQSILAMWNDPSSYVKNALLDALESRELSQYMPTLIGLVGDSFLDGEDFAQDGRCFVFARRAAKLLSRCAPLSVDQEIDLLDAARATEDPILRDALYSAVALQGSSRGRTHLLEICEKAGRWRVRAAAARALFDARSLLEPDLVAKVDHHLVLSLPAPVAIALVGCVGHAGSLIALEALAFELSKNADKRVLLAPLLAAGARAGRAQIEAIVLNLLPVGHAAGALRLPAKAAIPRDALDDLGDVPTVNVAQEWLKDWLQPKRSFAKVFPR